MQKHSGGQKQENGDKRWVNPHTEGMAEWEQERRENGLPPDTHGHWAWRLAGRPKGVKTQRLGGKI